MIMFRLAQLAGPTGSRFLVVQGSINVTFLRSVAIRRAVVAVATMAFGMVGSAKADFVLDDFSNPLPASTYSITSAANNPYTSPGVDLGGVTRTAVVTAISGLGGPSSSASGFIGQGFFELSTTAAVTATAQVTYSYAAPQDYTALGVTGMTFSFAFSDLNVPFSVVLTDSTGGASTFTTTAATGPGSYEALLSNFTGTANLASITGVDVFLNQNTITGANSTSADFLLDEITVQNTPPVVPAVPAPPAIILALAAVPVLGARRFFRKSAAK
jgi:hypothetical protein